MTPVSEKLRAWLLDEAFPLWHQIGIDRVNGGFVEQLDVYGNPLDEPKRARLTARQIYAFAAAKQLGWNGAADDNIHHGFDFLTRVFISEGRVIPVVSKTGAPLAVAFDLYDCAFVMFGLAAAAEAGHDPIVLETLARNVRDSMQAGWAHPTAGFHESHPPSMPLKANPHMHILEASLAWSELSRDVEWGRMADGIAELCLARFIDEKTGALGEFYDLDWTRQQDGDLGVIEPGHMFEWAWLLIRWGLSRGRRDAIDAGRRLIDTAERHGVSHQDLAVNTLAPDMTVRDGRHRLWPQTERLKAFVALSWIAEDDGEARYAVERADQAASGLMRFFEPALPGAWREHIETDGSPAAEPTRASSLYHIACAALEYRKLSLRLEVA